MHAMRDPGRRSRQPVARDRAAYRTSRTSRREGDRKPPTATELLDKYAQAQDKIKSIIVKGQYSSEWFHAKGGAKYGGKTRRAFEFRSDGRRRYFHSAKWGYINPRLPNVARPDARHLIQLYDGKSYIKYSLTDVDQMDLADDGTHTWGNSPLMGCLFGTHERVDSILRGSGRISVRDSLERVGRSQCYVIDAVTERGRYTLWIDPEHGYNIARAELSGGKGDMIYDIKCTEADSFYSSIQDVRFRKVNDLWVPVQARVEFGHDLKPPFGRMNTNQRIKRTDVVLNPEHQALRSFYPDEIPSGAEIERISFSGDIPDQEDFVNYVFRWKPGAKLVVNRQGRLVSNNPNKDLLPIVTVLTGFDELVEDYAVELDPLETVFKTEGKMILQCFWDINQKQSQQGLLALRDRQEALAQKGLSVIAVEGSGAQTDKVHSWARKNKLTFPAGAFHACYKKFSSKRDDLDDTDKKTVLASLVTELHMAWRIEKLPWLILADRNHVVTAEGFSLEELDEKIKDAEQAEVVTNKIAHLAPE
jgi:hypothetical protein